MNPLLAAFLALVLGTIVGYVLRQILASARISSAESRAHTVLNEAKSKSQDILLEAKNKAIKLLEDAKKEEKDRNAQLTRIENLLTKKEDELDQKSKELLAERDFLKSRAAELTLIKADLEQGKERQMKELERITDLTRDAAKIELIAKIEQEYKDELYTKIRKLELEGKEEVDKRARELMIMTIQRYASSQIADATTTVVNLPSDEVKGKIIGKEGRNIKTIERLTGVDIIIDDTPEALVVSGFDPVRRQVARLAIEKLIADGRIHPAKIEEMVDKAKAEINDKIKEAGEAALFEVGVGPIDPKLTYLLGRLAFRTSFGQNVLLHSIEMSHIAAMLASELGADVSVARKAALFHDIGKAVDHEVQGTHVEIGRKILAKFGIDKKVIEGMEAHHEEYPYSSIESRIVQAADAISGARPGARKDTVEIYLKRLEELEKIATSFEGVEKSYAVQAGRELRIFVMPTKIDDLGAIKLAKDVAKKVEEDMKYPGEIRVNVIRETRAVEYAR
ncbi:MAG: ribonuclease Y [Candidatus Yanofskybacteria bacterium RIFOXYD1_FULL_44_17]|nr:MAG: ribonuclease Y [Candidatus Yanofskybacteria bacterium RIFOXYA2_FULL_45_28]OGN36966.1 MAG: ribonuclease Y [Candidatus Yanofskybacteria bacterium RIFOXYA1_FULL_44_17]OGN38408.1 MAG: ribonuclease Y [Candidatus Yanofskybacteria bacterium RIFOXYC1_FULL_44_16]OGN38636.1 MAG: ribonuclease Y [Candidatus Yanofskybacteria bacterium RIFOXYB2_FULL_44_18]OGN38877.1 MAG: ribonuclease Y [Candidatus Yanofskybacteria bacterium RIFOXYB1_FULL_44_29]OGN40058.1 MAG: ribonuclease Y [Candidatus Yanofskybacte